MCAWGDGLLLPTGIQPVGSAEGLLSPHRAQEIIPRREGTARAHDAHLVGGWIGELLKAEGAVGLLPITGIVLPFISYGGTAMVSIFIGLSLAHNETLYNE